MKKITLIIFIVLISPIFRIEAQNVPIIDCIADIVVNNDTGLCGAIVSFDSATATDIEDGDLTTIQTMGLPSGSAFPVGESIIEFSATDTDSNTVTCQFSIVVNDTEAPIVVCKQDFEVDLDIVGNISINPADLVESISENCNYTLSPDPIVLDCSNVGENTVEISVIDMGGNLVVATATVIVKDVIAPILECDDEIIIELDGNGEAHITPDDMTSTMYDACGFNAVLLNISDFDCSDIDAPIVVTLFVNDISGNFASCQTLVTVIDNMPPYLNCPGDMRVHSDASGVYIVPDYFAIGEAFAEDNCTDEANIIISQTPVMGTVLGINAGTSIPPYVISFTAKDESGNIAVCEFEMIVWNCVCSVNDNNLDKLITLQPNPANNKVVVMNNSKISLNDLLIYSLQGSLISQVSLVDLPKNTIDISRLKSGIYIFKIISNNESIYKTIIVEQK